MTIRSDKVAASRVLHLLLPLPGLAAYEIRDFDRAPPLHPDEQSFIASASPRRAAEFAAGRACGRRALADLGVHDFGLRMAADRGPVWPDGVVGSITHCAGYCGAVAIDGSASLGIGIDAERPGALGPDAERSFCTPVEQQWLARLAPDARALAATLLFSSKEAFLKAQAPVTGRIPDLREIEVHVRPGVFEVQPNAVHRPEASLRRVFHGRYEWLQDHLICGISLPPDGESGAGHV